MTAEGDGARLSLVDPGSPADAVEASPPVFHIVGRPTARGTTWAWVQDDLDMATVAAAEDELSTFLAAGTPGSLLVYVGEERFVDLRGLRLLLRTAARVRGRGGVLAVVAPPACLRLLVDILGLGDDLPLLPTARRAGRWAGRRRG